MTEEGIQSTEEMIERAEGGLGDVFQYLKDHVDEFEAGDIDPEDLPHVSPDAGGLIMASVIFGLMWEREYPATDKEAIKDRLVHTLGLAIEHLDAEDYCELEEAIINVFGEGSGSDLSKSSGDGSG